MEVTAAAAAAYEAALPADPRVENKKMFGTPCAFVNRQMFFGTFGDSIIARVGPTRVKALAGQAGMQVFTPTEGRSWHDYVQLPPTASADTLKGLAEEALAWTSVLPAKVKKPKAPKRAKA
ncbi:MAG: TfoX/Sxy family protein [Myxococcota bacterium]